MKIVGSLFGSAPKTSAQPIADTEAEQKKAKTSRAALLSTEGGITGAELQPGQVGRSGLFGNVT